MTFPQLPPGFSPLRERLSTWAAGATPSTRSDYVAALVKFLERARKVRRTGSVLMLAAIIASASRLQGDQGAGPISIVNLLTTGALACLLPVAYAIGLRRWFAGHVAHDLGSATYRLLLNAVDGGATALQVHAPLLPPESLGAGDLLRWGLGDDTSWWMRFTARVELAASCAVLALLVLAGPALCVVSALRAPGPWGLLGALLGGLLVLTALRPFEAVGGVRERERSRY